ncbi:hypothetical protein GCM10009760_21330 [Kitasatospora kazusensis]|uniref:Uncharacterized protein n=1 Tax=Kitasatospora kazusensis TaxID=407974 RepID=A0ABN2ZAK1_9ACTN
MPDVTAHHTIAEGPVEEWDRLLGGPGFHLSRAWPASAEAKRGETARYPLSMDGEGTPPTPSCRPGFSHLPIGDTADEAMAAAR